MFRTFKNCFKFSNYLESLYQQSKTAQTPFFTINSSAIRIIEDPLDFYALLCGSIANSSQKIGLSCLYLSTGPLQRHLLGKIGQRHKRCPDLQSSFVFDDHRSSRQQYGQSPKSMLKGWAQQIGPKTSIAFQKVGPGKGVLGQVLGVHHQKIYIFDDRVVLTGANLSKNYFLNRRDRVISIDSPELSDYLFEYLQILAQSPKELLTHYRLWKYAYMPTKYCTTFAEQVEFLSKVAAERNAERDRTFQWEKAEKSVIFSKNAQIAKQLGTSITEHEPMATAQLKRKRQTTRDRLFGVKSEDYVGNELEQLGENAWNTPIKAGKDIYLFPFIQWSALQEHNQYNVFSQLLKLAVKQNNIIKLTSGYLNLDLSLFSQLAKQSKTEKNIQLLCSAPQANSFYKAGGLKSLVPVMYRCYQWNLLKQLGDKVVIKQFWDGKWSYHAKGIWIEEAQNSLTTVVGSSNFNHRSKSRDSEFQFYIYSGCQDFNDRLKKQWQQMQKHCKTVSLEDIQKDEDVKVSSFHRFLSKLASSIL